MSKQLNQGSCSGECQPFRLVHFLGDSRRPSGGLASKKVEASPAEQQNQPRKVRTTPSFESIGTPGLLNAIIRVLVKLCTEVGTQSP